MYIYSCLNFTTAELFIYKQKHIYKFTQLISTHTNNTELITENNTYVCKCIYPMINKSNNEL